MSLAAVRPNKPPLPLTIRPARAADRALINDAWLRKLRATAPYSSTPAGWFFAAQRALIEKLLDRESVTTLVACSQHNPDQAYGFIVAEAPLAALHWVYVKESFREARVASRLLEAALADPERLIASVQTPELFWLVPGILVDPHLLGESRR